MVYYTIPLRCGTDSVQSLKDGTTINVSWFKAYPSVYTNSIAYNIYYSTIKEDIYSEGIKYVSIDDVMEANLIDLTPGQEYFVTIRPVEYNSSYYNLDSMIPVIYDNLRLIPKTVLRSDITETSLIIPLLDTSDFPNYGTIKVGVEVIQYSAKDTDNNLILTDISQRGYNNSKARSHTISGYDGYNIWNSDVLFHIIGEDTQFDKIFMCQSRFEYPNYQMTLTDGYHQILTDVLTSDLTASDDYNKDFPMYDYAGYHRTDPVMLINGTCVGSYIGGQMGCIDGYGNVNMLRGISLQDINTQRQELGLSMTGRVASLIKRVRTGITCACYQPSSEYPDDRCPLCLGGGFVYSFEQYFDNRRSDGRIMVRVSPADEDVKMTEAGLESDLTYDCWTLTVPTIKDRDIIIFYDMNDNEEYRYEVLSVNRNNTVLGLQGGQHFKAQRIRKTDPAYQIRVFSNTSLFPSKLITGIGFTTGIPPHTHTLTISEKITSVSQINQMTSVSSGHNHVVVNGVIAEALGHTHTIVII